jgi:hypothetical protein
MSPRTIHAMPAAESSVKVGHHEALQAVFAASLGKWYRLQPRYAQKRFPPRTVKAQGWLPEMVIVHASKPAVTARTLASSPDRSSAVADEKLGAEFALFAEESLELARASFDIAADAWHES